MSLGPKLRGKHPPPPPPPSPPPPDLWKIKIKMIEIYSKFKYQTMKVFI
jgi:hypothetical protein